MKRKVCLFFLILMMAAAIMPANKAEAASSVKVSLPAFKVSLNGVKIENNYKQYPLIVYKDITYFPMTYYESRFMGLETVWDNSTGLKIIKTGANWSYQSYESLTKNSSIYNAQIAPFKITVNGKAIDNSIEEYPLLLFRNITYFPLTWRFAVEEFGWKYTFDQNKGLAVNSTDSTPSAGQVTLPIVTRETGEKGAFTMAGDYFYYEGKGGIIYQAPVENPENAKQVYVLPDLGDGLGYSFTTLKTENSKVFLKYHTGGATMGSDHLILLNEDGTYRVLDDGYSYALMKFYDDYTIRVAQHPFAVDNLEIKKKGAQDYDKLGMKDYSYGIYIKEHGTGSDKSRSGSPSNDLYLINDEIYVLGHYGYLDENIENSTTGIYKINIKSNKQTRLCDNEVVTFKIVNDVIYFKDENSRIYKIPLEGGIAELLVNEEVDSYEILEGKLYYSLKDKKQLYVYGNEEPVNPNGILKSLEVQNGYMVAIFDKLSESQYKLMIFNEEGKVLYKSIENVLSVRIDNGKIVFVKDN